MNTDSSMKLKITISVAFVLIAVGAYVAVSELSSPAEQDLMSEFKAAPPLTPNPTKDESSVGVAPVGVLLAGLKQRLETQPNDIDGWVLLSKSYFHLSQFKPAKEAFEKARALGYTGDWQPLPRIDAFGRQGLPNNGFGSPIDFSDSRIKTVATPTTGSADETFDQAGTSDPAGLNLKVSLDPALTKEITPESAVFVFVRAAQNPGPPLAVVRKRVDELPFEIALDDSHAMMPNRTISSVENVIVGARISATGNALRQPGDYEQLSDSIPASFRETIELVIKKRI